MISNTSERKALDHTHHLSQLAIRRDVSPLKGLFKYAGKPGMLILAGGKGSTRFWITCAHDCMIGLPPADYFPFHSVSAEALVHVCRIYSYGICRC
jgi:aromatic amino acid aminotransferase I